MPIEFIVVGACPSQSSYNLILSAQGVGFFDTKWPQSVSSPTIISVLLVNPSLRHAPNSISLSQYVQLFSSQLRLASASDYGPSASVLTSLLAVHVIRIHAIYDKSRPILFGMGALFALQVVVTAVCCGFYRGAPTSLAPIQIHDSSLIAAVPLLEGQGCISGIRHDWVGIYWVFPALLYTVSVSSISITSRDC